MPLFPQHFVYLLSRGRLTWTFGDSGQHIVEELFVQRPGGGGCPFEYENMLTNANAIRQII